MKSKVLASGSGLEPDTGVFETEVKSDEKLELVKDGVPVGEPEHLVEKMMVKLDSALRRRDENIRNVMISLEEDNKQLRQELELYRKREVGVSEQNTHLESKIQMVLDSMEKLGSMSSKSPRSDNSNNDSTKTVHKFKRRSKSRPKESKNKDASTSESDPKDPEVPKLKPKRQSAFENDSCSSTDNETHQPNKSRSAVKVDKLQVLVTNTQSENVALKQDLVEQKEKEAQLVKRNLELEAKLVKALTPSEDQSISPAAALSEHKVESREVQTSAQGGRSCVTTAINTDMLVTVMSPSSSSPSKSDSPVKDETNLNTKTRKSRARVKVRKKF